MHELGIVFYIIRDVKEVAGQNGVSHVSKVTMDIGEVSTVIPDYLKDCWGWATDKEDLLRGCVLEVNTTPAVSFCEDCRQEFPTVTHGKICPHCSSEKTYLLRGNEVEIREIEVSDSE